MNEYQHLFEHFANPLRHSHFKEDKEGKDQHNSCFRSDEIICKVKARTHSKTNRILHYSITLLDKVNEPLLHLNYLADCAPFIPESVRYIEPTWQDFTNAQLAKAIKYLTPLLHIKMKPNRSRYSMLVFKDCFYLAIRVKNEHNELEHNLCIKAYNYSLDN